MTNTISFTYLILSCITPIQLLSWSYLTFTSASSSSSGQVSLTTRACGRLLASSTASAECFFVDSYFTSLADISMFPSSMIYVPIVFVEFSPSVLDYSDYFMYDLIRMTSTSYLGSMWLNSGNFFAFAGSILNGNCFLFGAVIRSLNLCWLSWLVSPSRLDSPTSASVKNAMFWWVCDLLSEAWCRTTYLS